MEWVGFALIALELLLLLFASFCLGRLHELKKRLCELEKEEEELIKEIEEIDREIARLEAEIKEVGEDK